MTTVTTETPTASELAVRLRRSVVRLSRRLRRHEASGLSLSLVSALAVVGRRGPLTPSELADIEDVRRPTATRLIAILERRGFVDRTVDLDDRRSYRVAATTRGKALLAESRMRRDAYLAHALSTCSDDDLLLLDRALALLERLVEASR